MGLSSLGAFGVATEKFAIISEMWPQKAVEAITKALEVPITKLTIGDTSLVGILIAANSNGILLPHIFSQREMDLRWSNIRESGSWLSACHAHA